MTARNDHGITSVVRPVQTGSATRDPAGLRQLAAAYRLSQAVATAASIGVGDALADGPLDSALLASALGAHEATLNRLLRALAGEGVLTEDSSGRFALTELGQCLRSDDPDGTREMILGWSCLAETYLAFARLPETVMTGRSGFELEFDEPFYQYLDHHPGRAAAYARATDSTVAAFDAAIASYDFTGTRTVVDVGGGGGVLLTSLLRAYPTIRGVLLERPPVIDQIRLPADVANRIDCVAGDALQSVPGGADAYLLSTVLRCFDDAGCHQILTACRAAMDPAATLLALEMVLPSGPLPPAAGLADLQALMVYGGGDRDEDSWTRLLSAAGLALDRIQPADGPYSWLIARTTDPNPGSTR